MFLTCSGCVSYSFSVELRWRLVVLNRKPGWKLVAICIQFALCCARRINTFVPVIERT